MPLQTACMAAFDASSCTVNALAPGSGTASSARWLRLSTKTKPPARRHPRVAGTEPATGVRAGSLRGAGAGPGDARALGERYHVLCPENLDGKRDQNSLVLCCKERFEIHDPEWRGETTASVAGLVAGRRAEPAPRRGPPHARRRSIARDDPACEDGGRYVLASFHGDTNARDRARGGRARQARAAPGPAAPTPNDAALAAKPPKLVFGMDATTHAARPERAGRLALRRAPREARVVCRGVEPPARAHHVQRARL